MSRRFRGRTILLNQDPLYDKFMEQRNRRSVRQYSTPTMHYPTAKEMSDLTRVPHIWKAGDRYYKLSIQYYGEPQYWWVIAFFNQKPTESMLQVGDIVNVPTPLDAVLRAYSG